MNLSDIQDEGKELISILPETKAVMDSLIEITNTKETFKIELFKKSFSAYYCASTKDRDYINGISNMRESYCNNFINQLRKVRFRKTIIELTRIEKKFNYYEFEIFREDFFCLIDKINEYTESQNNIREFDKIEEVYNDITKVTNMYNKMITNINKINELVKLLSPEVEECKFKIRFMNENKSLQSLKENIILIENIYDNINRLIGNEEEKLTYCKAESGTFALWLGGCATTLLAILPILKFGYQVYSEQLSTKAKLEIKLKQEELKQSKIKTRGEYLRLILEYKKSKGLESLNISDEKEIQTIMGEVDNGVRELFSKIQN